MYRGYVPISSADFTLKEEHISRRAEFADALHPPVFKCHHRNRKFTESTFLVKWFEQY